MLEIKTDYSLKSLNTFGLDVKTTCYINVPTTEDALDILKSKTKKSYKKPLLVLGGGSNLLFQNDFTGTVIHPTMQGIEVSGETKEDVYLRAGAGVSWDDFVAYCVENGWGGVENLSHIPGNVGASPVQNIGAYGVEAKDSIISVRGIYLDRHETFTFDNPSCCFGYRNSIFKHELKGKVLITHVSFRLSKKPAFITHYGNVHDELISSFGGEVNLVNIRKAIISIRQQKLPEPEVLGSAGSFFKNPTVPKAKADFLKKEFPNIPCYPTTNGEVKLAAGWLIEQCGWKGKRVGNVGVYPQQALVLVNYGDAKGSEIVELSKEIQQSVKQKFAVTLEPEVNII